MVSIIIPVKNEELNLPILLKSIRAQSYKSREVIVVDTGSSDNTMLVARKLGALVFEKGPERSAARNWGAKKAHGDLLLFLDADMELTRGVLQDCVDSVKKQKVKALIVPERTVGANFMAIVRRFEREMYKGESIVEVARLFSRDVFFENRGYDLNLTGPEDYDLPYRISKKHKIGRSHEYILHHEENLTLWRLLKKRYYYASRGAAYASKHPELVLRQGALIFRKAYFRNWKKFLKNPVIGVSFIFVRILETVFAVFGFISAVGINGFIGTLLKSIIQK